MIEIEKPQIECIETPGDVTYGKYVVEPLERGYGTALGNMVGSLTVGKKKYADVEAEIIDLKKKCDALQKELDNMSRELRLLDNSIQAANWQTEL